MHPYLITIILSFFLFNTVIFSQHPVQRVVAGYGNPAIINPQSGQLIIQNPGHGDYKTWLFYGYLLSQHVWINLPRGNQRFGLIHIVRRHGPQHPVYTSFFNFPPQIQGARLQVNGGRLLEYAIAARDYIHNTGVHITNAHHLYSNLPRRGRPRFVQFILNNLVPNTAFWRTNPYNGNLEMWYNAGQNIGTNVDGAHIQRPSSVVIFVLRYNLNATNQYSLNITTAFPY